MSATTTDSTRIGAAGIPHIVIGERVPKSSTAPRTRRSTQTFVAADAAELAACVCAGTSLAWVAFYRVLPLTGTTGFLIVAYLLSLAFYALVERNRHGRLVARDRMITVTIASLGAIIVGVLVFILSSVFVRGLGALRTNFFTQDLSSVGPFSGVDQGGALHSIVGSLEQVVLAVLMAVPIAIGTAVFLNEIRGRFAPTVRMFVTAMSGLPSILAGLFIAAFWLVQLGHKFSGFAGSLALAVMMMPAVTRTSEEVLRLVPGGLREASLALGASEWRSTLQVVLPTARTGLITAVLLGTARAVGEAAPLLNTTFGSTRMNLNPFNGPQDSLPFLIWESYRSPSNSVVNRGWTAALVLLVIVLALFVTARTIGSKGPGGRRG